MFLKSRKFPHSLCITLCQENLLANQSGHRSTLPISVSGDLPFIMAPINTKHQTMPRLGDGNPSVRRLPQISLRVVRNDAVNMSAVVCSRAVSSSAAHRRLQAHPRQSGGRLPGDIALIHLKRPICHPILRVSRSAVSGTHTSATKYKGLQIDYMKHLVEKKIYFKYYQCYNRPQQANLARLFLFLYFNVFCNAFFQVS